MSHDMHSHPNPTELHAGCPACIKRRKNDQELAAWKDAPLRRCTWRFTASDKAYTFTLDVRVPAGVEPWQVDEWHAGATGPAISDALGDDQGDFYDACCTIACTNIGAIVPEPAPVVDQPDLFGSAS